MSETTRAAQPVPGETTTVQGGETRMGYDPSAETLEDDLDFLRNMYASEFSRARLRRIADRIAARLSAGGDRREPEAGTPKCHICLKPATCFGTYEGISAHSCDDCCGHGNEDGTCEPIPAALSRREDETSEGTQEDRERLDWLDGMLLADKAVEFSALAPNSDPPAYEIRIAPIGGSAPTYFDGATLNEVIDNARAATLSRPESDQ